MTHFLQLSLFSDFPLHDIIEVLPKDNFNFWTFLISCCASPILRRSPIVSQFLCKLAHQKLFLSCSIPVIIHNCRHTFDSSVKFVQLSPIPTNISMRNKEFFILLSSEYSTKYGDNVWFLLQYLYISKERRGAFGFPV